MDDLKTIDFSKIATEVRPDNLLSVQLKAFADFLQKDVAPEKRKRTGLQAAFRDTFPIRNSDESLELDFVSYEFGEPYHTPTESIARGMTYSLPLHVTFHLRSIENNRSKEIAEQKVYFGEFPVMTETGSFIINGAERVVVNQIHRSPGVIFEEDEEQKVSVYGKRLYVARIIPYRGSWVEMEFEPDGKLLVTLDKRRKFPITTFLRAAGIEDEKLILALFADYEEIEIQPDLPNEALVGRFAAVDIVDKKTGEVIVEANQEITKDKVTSIRNKNIETVKIHKNPAILLSLLQEMKGATEEKGGAAEKERYRRMAQRARVQIYQILKSQEYSIPVERAANYLDDLFFKSHRRYDLTRIGRFKINRKLESIFKEYEERFSKGDLKKFSEEKIFSWKTPSPEYRLLTREDIIATICYLLRITNGDIVVAEDDIDHLGNRRVRTVSELLENQVRIALYTMSRGIRERLNTTAKDSEELKPRQLINFSVFQALIKKFFGTSQLSQFLDQTNPLAELTHKRRLSALGPGGLNRKRAGFEVRDVHYTHYGRICPIETPEGGNIGLISSLGVYSRLNEYGLIETPYRLVKNGRVTDEVRYFTADEEDTVIIAQANTRIDKNGKILDDLVICRQRGDVIAVPPEKVNYIDITPIQVVGASASLIPFLEHDDANRALMGSNMQRQAVPLLFPEVPLVATGMERQVATDSGTVVLAKRDGRVISVEAREILVINEESKEIDRYILRKYERSNQDTCINQIPLVKAGQKVRKGQVIADGMATTQGQLALGKNLLVAFMPWEGYNFEDAIVVSEKVLRDNVFTSIHISEFICEARESRGRAEEITRDIPNTSSDELLNLGEDGIVRIGTEVQPYDILVGKTAPKGEQQSSPEERLLRVLFGHKSEDVKDDSLRVPPGITGKVIGVQVFVSREKISSKKSPREKNKNVISPLDKEIASRLADLRKERDRVKEMVEREKETRLKENKKPAERRLIEIAYRQKIEQIEKYYKKEEEYIKKGEELPISVNKSVKVYVATTRYLQVGDKLAGRHGNKGVIAKIVRVEDMPHLPDGTPVDVLLSPLSVPSRMNVGQLLEAMLGWAAKMLNVQCITPVFAGATEHEVKEKIKEARAALIKKGVPEKYLPDENCQITLYDGRTGEPFMEKITIGYMYLMKLIHMVEDKIHARSTGPYALITRQPLGGKAQFGGQRFGEMEVWALEGYGAANALQEFLTIKSDDETGRIASYEAITHGRSFPTSGVPETFRVLVSELRALGLNVELKNIAAQAGKTKEKTAKEKVLK